MTDAAYRPMVSRPLREHASARRMRCLRWRVVSQLVGFAFGGGGWVASDVTYDFVNGRVFYQGVAVGAWVGIVVDGEAG